MDLEKLRQLIERWQTLLASTGLLIGGLIAVRTQILSLKPQEWSWPEPIAIVLAVAAVGAVAIRSRRTHLSRLVDPEALKLDPQSPEADRASGRPRQAVECAGQSAGVSGQ
jgi:hypothetical protein